MLTRRGFLKAGGLTLLGLCFGGYKLVCLMSVTLGNRSARRIDNFGIRAEAVACRAQELAAERVGAFCELVAQQDPALVFDVRPPTSRAEVDRLWQASPEEIVELHP